MRTPEQHLAVLGLLAHGARDEAVREAAAWAAEVARKAEQVRAAQAGVRSLSSLSASKAAEREPDGLLRLRAETRQLDLWGGR